MRRTHQRVVFATIVSALLTACLPPRSFRLDLTPQPTAEAAKRGIVAVEVGDDRPFVTSGRKHPSYIGHYRGAYGNIVDVRTNGREPLAALIERDLATDLQALGFRIASPKDAQRTLLVSIVDWNFESNTTFSTRFWYELRVRVINPDMETLTRRALSDESVVEGSFWRGAMNIMEREMPRLYSEVIRRIVREDPEVRQALEN